MSELQVFAIGCIAGALIVLVCVGLYLVPIVDNLRNQIDVLKIDLRYARKQDKGN